MAGATIGEYSGTDHRTESGFECFTVEGLLSVRFSTAVLQQIRAAAVGGLMTIRRGGLEIGGVLFGTIEAADVSILQIRPLSIEYVNGPSFTLSESDHASLSELINTSSSDPELTGMVPVGWYHSHTRSALCLSPDDVALHQRHFPGAQQIA